MFSLTDAHAPKVHFISVLLEKRFPNGQVFSKLQMHSVVARNEAEAFGMLILAYKKRDPDIQFRYWVIWSDFVPEDITNMIHKNNATFETYIDGIAASFERIAPKD